MRRFDEPIEVRDPLTSAEHEVGDITGTPMQFLWRGRLWTVRNVQARWRETGAWWRRCDDGAADLLDESQLWRVYATSGLYGASTVAELAHRADGRWLLRSVVD